MNVEGFNKREECATLDSLQDNIRAPINLCGFPLACWRGKQTGMDEQIMSESSVIIIYWLLYNNHKAP